MITPINETANLKSSNSKKSPAIRAGCEKFATIGTNTNFKPTAGNFDEFYNGITCKDGIGDISESKPGDMGLNDGRWHVNVLKEGFDPDKYLEVCSVEDSDLQDFMPTLIYFECP